MGNVYYSPWNNNLDDYINQLMEDKETELWECSTCGSTTRCVHCTLIDLGNAFKLTNIILNKGEMRPYTKKYTIPQRLRYVMSILFDNEPPDMPVHRGSGDIDGESVLHNQWEEDVNEVESIRDEYRQRHLSDRSLRLTEVEELNRIYKKWNNLKGFYDNNPDIAWCKTDVYQAWCSRPNPKESDSRLGFFANFYGIKLKENGKEI